MPQDQPLPNAPESRTPTGEIKPPETTTSQTQAPEQSQPSPTANAESKTQSTDQPKPDAEVKPPKEGESLLTKDKIEAPAGAPEKYEPFKLPEGYELKEDSATAAQTLFKELNLNQEAAQKLIDFVAPSLLEAVEAPFNAYQEVRNGWRNEVFKDPELGTGTAIKPEVKANIGKLIDTFGPNAQAFREAMDATGVGDHPAFVRAMNYMAQFATEGKSVTGTGPSPHGQNARGNAARPNIAQAMYPNLPSSSS